MEPSDQKRRLDLLRKTRDPSGLEITIKITREGRLGPEDQIRLFERRKLGQFFIDFQDLFLGHDLPFYGLRDIPLHDRDA